MTLSITEDSKPPFWNRQTVLYATCGAVAYLVSLWLFARASAEVLVAFSVVRLALGIGLAVLVERILRWGPSMPLYFAFVAIPYPVDLAAYIYSERGRWLPEVLSSYLQGPTAFLIFLIAVLLASRLVTSWAVARMTYESATERLRQLGGLLFALTAVSVIVAPSSVWFLRHVPEPLALVGYCAIVGSSRGDRV